MMQDKRVEAAQKVIDDHKQNNRDYMMNPNGEFEILWPMRLQSNDVLKAADAADAQAGIARVNRRKLEKMWSELSGMEILSFGPEDA